MLLQACVASQRVCESHRDVPLPIGLMNNGLFGSDPPASACGLLVAALISHTYSLQRVAGLLRLTAVHRNRTCRGPYARSRLQQEGARLGCLCRVGEHKGVPLTSRGTGVTLSAGCPHTVRDALLCAFLCSGQTLVPVVHSNEWVGHEGDSNASLRPIDLPRIDSAALALEHASSTPLLHSLTLLPLLVPLPRAANDAAERING